MVETVRGSAVKVVATLAMVAGLAGCSDEPSTASGNPTVVVTTTIWADIVANVACDQPLDLVTTIPIGADPHGFEPSLSDRARMDDAALVVANGLGLEEGFEDTLVASENAGTPTLRVAEQVETLPVSTSDDDEHDDDEHDDDEHDDDEDHAGDDHGAHDHEGDDPHIWFDPTLVASALPTIGEHLIVEAGLDRATTEACVATYQQALEELDGALTAMVADLPADQRTLVTSHDSLVYFAARYDFDVVGTVIPASSSLAETNPAQLERVADAIEAAGVRAIFTEAPHSNDDAEALGERLGVQVVPLFTGTLSAPSDGSGTYLEFMRVNGQLITDALR